MCGVEPVVWACVCGRTNTTPLPLVREKAKALVSLLKDEERLKEERRRAHLARERQIAQGNTASASPKTATRCSDCCDCYECVYTDVATGSSLQMVQDQQIGMCCVYRHLRLYSHFCRFGSSFVICVQIVLIV